MFRSSVDSKKLNRTQSRIGPSEHQALFLVPTEGATVIFLGLPLSCRRGWKQRDTNSLLALLGKAGPTSGMLAGNDLERCDGIHFQQFFPGA
jgi:hypothetical protein